MRFSGDKLRQFVFLGLGLAGAIGIITALWFLPKLQEEQFLQQSQLYEDKEYGFSFRFPKSWELVPDLDLQYKNEEFLVGVQDPARKTTAVGVIVEEKDPTKKLRFDYAAFVKSLEEQLSSLQDFKELSVREVNRDGYSGVDISYTFLHSSKANVRQRQLIFFKEGSLYYLSGGAIAKEYSIHRKELEGIFRSFRIIKKSSDAETK